MRNKKQTAVEWFWNQIENTEPNLNWYKILDQAKELEKQQIIDACYFAYNEGCSYMTDGKTEYESFEQYYTETYEERRNK